MTRGYQNDFWVQDGIEILSPTAELIETAIQKQKPNILSMVLRIRYNGHSIILGGDATADETWADIFRNFNLTGVSVYKASHHGRKSGYYQPAVKEMAPWLTITSVTEKQYDATNNYRRYSDHTVSLRDARDIKITIKDDGTLWYPKIIETHWKGKNIPLGLTTQRL